jgi:hypothetical protein
MNGRAPRVQRERNIQPISVTNRRGSGNNSRIPEIRTTVYSRNSSLPVTQLKFIAYRDQPAVTYTLNDAAVERDYIEAEVDKVRITQFKTVLFLISDHDSGLLDCLEKNFYLELDCY